MLRRLTGEGDISDNVTRMLHGFDTDVTMRTILRLHRDLYVVTDIHLDDDGKAYPSVTKISYSELKKWHEVQYGSPMQYMKQEDFEWLSAQY